VAVFYGRQRGGGHLEVAIEGRSQSVDTSGEGSDALVLAGATRHVELRAVGDGPVRVFGVSMEREHAGVIVDSLGIPGSRMRDRLPWDDASLRAQVAVLAPDLIVLAYGTNEVGFTGRPIANYRREVDEAVRRARAAAPSASCLLIGPSDRPHHRADGTWVARRRGAEVVNVQREIAREQGCGFFDLVALQGGPASMPRWVSAGLALGDYVHFTDEGHRIVARILARALLRGL
jgi:lysophospholipase L1-like esterase